MSFFTVEPLGAYPIFTPGAASLIGSILELYAPGPGPSAVLLTPVLAPM